MSEQLYACSLTGRVGTISYFEEIGYLDDEQSDLFPISESEISQS